jgi:hypothetical protein
MMGSLMIVFLMVLTIFSTNMTSGEVAAWVIILIGMLGGYIKIQISLSNLKIRCNRLESDVDKKTNLHECEKTHEATCETIRAMEKNMEKRFEDLKDLIRK